MAQAGRAHAGAALEVEARKQREAALQREVARQRAALAEAGSKIRHAHKPGLCCAVLGWMGCLFLRCPDPNKRCIICTSLTPRRQMQCGISLAADAIQRPDELKAAVVRLFQAHASAAGDASPAAKAGAAASVGGSGEAAEGADAAAATK